jgi:ferredoxin
MQIRIDSERCEGHALCYFIAPTLFSVDEEGHGVVIDPHVAECDQEIARHAMMSCPERAIDIEG